MPKSLVVDASFAIRLILPDPRRDLLRERLEQWLLEGYELVAPDLWLYEMTSALCQAAFFGLVTAEEAENSLPLISELAIRLVPAGAEQMRLAFAWTRSLNRAPACDSFYLALAESLGCELWTADQRLCKAANRPWVRFASIVARTTPCRALAKDPPIRHGTPGGMIINRPDGGREISSLGRRPPETSCL